MEPFLFEGVAVHNPLCDLPSHLTHDISTKLSTSSKFAIHAEKVKIAKLMEFGNIAANPESYERVLRYSPYHLPLDMKENRPITDLLLTVDEAWPYKYHARKMISKVREASARDPMYAFYHEFASQMYSEEQKIAQHYSFLINALLFNT